MTAFPTARLRAYVTAGVVGLLASLAVGDPGPALIAVPLLVVAIIGLAGGASPDMGLEIDSVPESVVEDEIATLRLSVTASEPVGSVYLDIGSTAFTIESVRGARQIGRSSIAIPSVDDKSHVEVDLKSGTWGRLRVGPLKAYVESPLGLFDLQYSASDRRNLLVVPEEEALRTLLAPLETNLHVGDLVSDRRGQGAEFADLRLYQPGDDPRTLNWRVSSRSREFWVNERHPERNGDVLLLVDGQVESGTELHALVDRSVRMAASLLTGHARRHHRLGLITLDGQCRWVYPGMGEAHRRRLVAQLMAVVPGEVLWDAAERALLRAARRPSMVIAMTSLMDIHLAGMLHAVRSAGVDVSIVEPDVDPVLPRPSGEARALGRRIWEMERQRLRDKLIGEGIPMVRWRAIDPPEVPINQLKQWRTSWRRLG